MFRTHCVVFALCIQTLQWKSVLSTCRREDRECEFWMEISEKLTMMNGRTAVYSHQGQLYSFDVTNPHNATPTDPENVVIADGWEAQRVVVVVNGTMPGPPIEVYVNQHVTVHVTNRMASSAVTIHWHGMHQKETPWMDGVPYVTQCPILPGNSFTYRFKATPPGTYFYHSHIGSQLGMGLVGPLIVREKRPRKMEEHIMVLQDYNHNDEAATSFLKYKAGDFVGRQSFGTSSSLDGMRFSPFRFHSGLINGRGRYLQEPGTHNETPLEEYHVKKGSSYRFRVIGAGITYPFRVSVDGHKFQLVASDGFDLKPVKVESFIIYPGERYDFILRANKRKDSYWIRAETLEVDVEGHVGLAILRYEGATSSDPQSRERPCTWKNKCLVANCPFRYYPKGSKSECITFGEMKGKTSLRTPGIDDADDEDIEEVFLNLGRPTNNFAIDASLTINAVRFKSPSSPALTQRDDISTFCKPADECGEEKSCSCTHALTLKYGKVYQVVFSGLGLGKSGSHPIHMHGHSFHVVKMGYGSYDPETGAFLAENPDIRCSPTLNNSDSLCNKARWADSSWRGNNVPGLQLKRSPVKDTIVVPYGGYTAVRIKADNPGVWFVHCHMDFHNNDGMAMMLIEAPKRHRRPPRGFPTCGDFRYERRHGVEVEDQNKEFGAQHLTQYSTENGRDNPGSKSSLLIGGFVGAFVIIACIVGLVIHRYRRNSTGCSTASENRSGYTALQS